MRNESCGLRRAACVRAEVPAYESSCAPKPQSCLVPKQMAVLSFASRKPLAARLLSGFTLIEVLAALVIVALGMMAVIQAVSQTASNSAYLRDKTIAHWVALNRVTEVRLEQSAPKVDKTSDEAEMAGRKWRWTMTVTQTPVETMRRIDVSVRPAEAKEGSSMAFVTGFYGSAIAPPGTALVVWEGLNEGTRGGDRDGDDDRDTDTDDDADDSPKEDPPQDPEPDPEPVDPPDDGMPSETD
jgi:general secretion pathway protein I